MLIAAALVFLALPAALGWLSTTKWAAEAREESRLRYEFLEQKYDPVEK
jgi:hypothetical protein